MKNIYRARLRREICAGLFAFALLGFVGAAFGMAVLSAGPVVLGTEMNANGTVEYLCLGRACEDYSAMRW
jgi:hypothetical protein